MLDPAIIPTIHGHLIGDHKWRNDGAGFVHVPKNASTSIRAACVRAGFTLTNTINPAGRFVAVIREPWERYCSGLAQYVATNYLPEARRLSFDMILTNMFVNSSWHPTKYDRFQPTEQPILFDQHTLPQWLYLLPFPETTTLIRFSKHMEPALVAALGIAGLPDYHPGDVWQRRLASRFGRALPNRLGGAWELAWLAVFNDDYNLWNEAND